jgi:deoxyribonuclease V
MRRFDELTDATDLAAEQRGIATLAPEPWRPGGGPIVAAGAFVAFARGEQGPGRIGDHAHVGAAATRDTTELARVVVEGGAGASYAPGLLAAREGALLEAGLRALMYRGVQPDVLLIDATGRDHPRRAGLALHLGARLEVPSVGVTHRPLLATGPEPDDTAGAWTELTLDGEVVGRWLRTRPGTRPLAIHAGWRTDPETATDVVLRVVGRFRTPEPLRVARCAAREARADAEGRRHPAG